MGEPYGGFPPHQKHSHTSMEAALLIADDSLTLREKVFIYIESTGEFGATDEEIQEQLQMGANTQRPRRRELQLKYRVADSGRTRETRSRRKAVVWVVRN